MHDNHGRQTSNLGKMMVLELARPRGAVKGTLEELRTMVNEDSALD